MSHVWGGFSELELLKGRERQCRLVKGSGNIITTKSKQSASSALTAHREKLSVLELILVLFPLLLLQWGAGNSGSADGYGLRAGPPAPGLLLHQLCFPAAQDFRNQAGFYISSPNHQNSVFKVSDQCCSCGCSAVFAPALCCRRMSEQVSDLRWELVPGRCARAYHFPLSFPGTCHPEKFFGECCHFFFLSDYSLN